MIKSKYIEFKKKREIGDIATDTFKFIRYNFKLILKLLAKTSGIPFVLFIAAQGYYTSITFSSSLFDFDDPFGRFDSPTLIIVVLLMYLCLFVFFAFLFTTILTIVKSYIKNNGVIVEEEVLQNTKDKAVSAILMAFSKYFILMFGTMFCIIPGVFLIVPMALVYPILVFEDKSISESISKAFDLFKNEWWVSFIATFLLGVLWYMISAVFSFPMIIYTWIKMFTVLQEGSLSDPSTFFDSVSITLTIIASAMQYIIYFILPLGSAFIYFNLNERKNQTGSLERINSIGGSDEE